MRRIMFCISQLGGGGAEQVIITLANAFSRDRYDVGIMTLYESDYEYEISDHISIFRLQLEEKSLIEKIMCIRNCLKQYNTDTFISFEYHLNLKVLLAATGLKIFKIISERNDPAQVDKRILLKKARELIYSTCNVLVCQTPDAKAYFPPKIQKKSVIIPNPLKDNLPLPYNGIRRKVIVNFCRLEEQKNLTLLVDAFIEVNRKYPEFHLDIYGNGKKKAHLEQYINQNKITHCVRLQPATRNILDIVKDTTMFVSSSNWEGLSNSMLEAMAIGLPVVCTDCPCGGARMMIKNYKNGILVPLGSKNALRDAMFQIIESPKSTKQMTLNGLGIRKDLHKDVIYMEWKKLVD